MIVFDIETGPRPVEEIKHVAPAFDPASIGKPPAAFDEADVKLGNVKDPQKIEERIAAARGKHEKDVAAFARKKLTAESDYWEDVIAKAALNAITGQVVAIGYKGKNELLHMAVDGVSERDLLVRFWSTYKNARATNRGLVGFNCKGFDVPFIAQRSWMIGVEVPATILTGAEYLDSTFIDIAGRWKVGVRWGGEKGYGTLDTISKALGLDERKSNEITGAQFAAKLYGTPEEREQAVRYLRSDIRTTHAVAESLGIL